ncbi:MAG: ABC transporter ATP-binding protein [Deltaproteobacteria bacterium]|jgi:ABC-2 type transport system ATP-binding protein|nr:ABC transporter ATP-binding protein [Deltaproteobacteria bacterium]
MIELKDLTKKYGDFKAVDDLNLCVKKGEVFGFIGPNGAGKTTTIKMMSGILEPTRGTVFISGINMQDAPEKAKSKIGFIPDRPYLYEKLSGMEFLKFTADLYRVPAETFQASAHQILKDFSLADWADELVESYSHGMKQRLIMSAALLHDPEVIIVDEPMVGLDPAAIIMVKALFRKLAGKGVTVFMSTHTLKVAQDTCDRIGVINKGRLIATGTTQELQRAANISEADLEQVFLNLTNNVPQT